VALGAEAADVAGMGGGKDVIAAATAACTRALPVVDIGCGPGFASAFSMTGSRCAHRPELSGIRTCASSATF
jgi:hypothetical protein